MKKISHKKICNTGALQIHVNTTLKPLNKSKNDFKSEIDDVKIKLHMIGR